jgi:hypothetical protein
LFVVWGLLFVVGVFLPMLVYSPCIKDKQVQTFVVCGLFFVAWVWGFPADVGVFTNHQREAGSDVCGLLFRCADLKLLISDLGFEIWDLFQQL